MMTVSQRVVKGVIGADRTPTTSSFSSDGRDRGAGPALRIIPARAVTTARIDEASTLLLTDRVQPAPQRCRVIAKVAPNLEGRWPFAPVAPRVERPNGHREKLGHFIQREQRLQGLRITHASLPGALPCCGRTSPGTSA